MNEQSVELTPQGFFLGPGVSRPMVILKGTAESDVLPVWLSHGEFDRGDLSPKGLIFHRTTAKVLKALGFELSRCSFVEIVGHHQYAELHFSKGKGDDRSDDVVSLKLRADEVMSLCLAGGARFFATPDFMEKCRNLNEEILELDANLAHAKREPAFGGQTYMM